MELEKELLELLMEIKDKIIKTKWGFNAARSVMQVMLNCYAS